MKGRTFYVILAFPLQVSLLVLVACAARPVVVISQAPDSQVISDIDVLVPQPFLQFERIQDERILSASDYQGDAIEASLLSASKNAVELRGFAMVDCRSLQSKEIVELCDQLRSISPKLSRGLISNETEILLKRFASFNKRFAVLVTFLQVKVGPGSFWNPSGGAIRSSMSSSLLRIALIHCVTKQILWKNQVLLRQLPQAESRQFSESLDLLYQSLPNGKEK